MDANGYPVVSYFDGPNLALKVLHCADSNCVAAKVPSSEIRITNTYQNPLPKTCFDVMDSDQVFLFSVCDNDFQGTPNFAPPSSTTTYSTTNHLKLL